MSGIIEAVHCSPTHSMRKVTRQAIRLLEGLGVEGDAHLGATVMHRSRRGKGLEPPNLRQVHLIHAELHDELRTTGFSIGFGEMGENITTRGIDLLCLPEGARLHLGPDAVVEVTGLRNPCRQLDGIQPGLMKAVMGRDAGGGLVRKTGVMSIVLVSGDVRAGDAIGIELPPKPHRSLAPV